MSTFRLHLWREWREHRSTLLFLALALPLLSGLAALRLPKRFVGDPWMACALITIFVVVVLVAVGGELLGRERRGTGLRWLERLPGGLGHPFAAKLSLHLSTSVVAGVLGFACAQAFAWLRSRGDYVTTIEFVITLPLVVTLSAWTFACSAWALRGGTAILAAGLGLGLAAYPVLNVLLKGYEPSGTELVAGTGLTLVAGLVSAALGFISGSRLGAGQGRATALGVLPLLPLAGLGGAWSLDRLEQRARIEPAAGDFTLDYCWITADGKTALVIGRHEDAHWNHEMPSHVLRADLRTGEWRLVARDYFTHRVLSTLGEDGLLRESVLVLNSNQLPHETAVSLDDGRLAKVFTDATNWDWAGLGQWQWSPELNGSKWRDPFRRQDYTEKEIEPTLGSVDEMQICPGRWLVELDLVWHYFDPDAGTLEPVDIPRYSTFLALLPDGRALFEHCEQGFFLLDPATGDRTGISSPPNLSLRWAWTTDTPDLQSSEPVDSPVTFFARTDQGWSWYDQSTNVIHTTAVSGAEGWYVDGYSDGRILLVTWNSLVELDLRTGERRQVFPRPPES